MSGAGEAVDRFVKLGASLLFLSAGMVLSGCAGAGVVGVSPSPTPNPTPTTHSEWTWVNGASTVDQYGVPGTPGTYGVKGTAAIGNAPGTRVGAVTWTDQSGNFWLFGGNGGAGTRAGGVDLGTDDFLNDLWRYSNGQWTWMSGSNAPDASGTYGSVGVPAPSNAPGARSRAVSWTDAQGNFWLFGGFGRDATGALGELNDLWEYSGGEWKWVSGSNLADQPGVYGDKGVASPTNAPGGRDSAAGWTDSSGNFWLFSGGNRRLGLASDDLWRYSGGEWTWMSGSNVPYPNGREIVVTYGTQGVPDPGNTPGPRFGEAAWTDSSGDLWLFGGRGSAGELDDLWKYSAGEWTWMGGSTLENQNGAYGVQGTAAAGNTPGGREGAVGWTDSSGNLWLFGGFNGFSDFNDLWKYSGGQWTWVSGSNTAEQLGAYGTQGTASAGNVPGARDGGVSWVDMSGNLWLFGGDDRNHFSTLPTDGTQTYSTTDEYFGDLWEYQP